MMQSHHILMHKLVHYIKTSYLNLWIPQNIAGSRTILQKAEGWWERPKKKMHFRIGDNPN